VQKLKQFSGFALALVMINGVYSKVKPLLKRQQSNPSFGFMKKEKKN